MTEPSRPARRHPPGTDEAPRRRRWPPPQTHEDRRRVLDTVTFERSNGRVWRFAVLMTLSIVIAVMGLTLDSAAVVIGAMLIAPLMTPVMGVAAAVSMGWPRHALRAALVVAATIAGGVAVAYAVAALTPNAGVTHEILSRTAPDLRDLVVAVAAGLAGSYALTREDVSAVLPGVAVAVALVPPLATIGVVARLGRMDLARGAALLFITNLVAIALTGVVVFLVTGFVPIGRLARVRGRVLGATLTILVATIAAAVPLSIRTEALARQASDLRKLNTVVAAWLSPVPSLEVTDIHLDGNAALVKLDGPEAPPDIAELDASVKQALGADRTVSVQWTQRKQALGGGRENGQVPTVAELQPIVARWLAGATAPMSIRSIERGDRKLTVEVDGTEPPPAATELAKELRSRAGFTVDVVVRWNRVPTQDSTAIAEAAARTWLASHPGLTLLRVEATDSAVSVTLAGTRKPADASGLAALVRRALGKAVDLSVQFVPAALVPTTPSG